MVCDRDSGIGGLGGEVGTVTSEVLDLAIRVRNLRIGVFRRGLGDFWWEGVVPDLGFEVGGHKSEVADRLFEVSDRDWSDDLTAV